MKGSRSSKRKVQFSAFTILDCLYESRPICNLTAMSQRLWDNLSCKIVSSPRFVIFWFPQICNLGGIYSRSIYNQFAFISSPKFVIWGAFPASLLLLFNFYFLTPGSLLLLALGKFLDELFVLPCKRLADSLSQLDNLSRCHLRRKKARMKNRKDQTASEGARLSTRRNLCTRFLTLFGRFRS